MHAEDAFTAHDGALKASSEALQVLMIRGSRPPAIDGIADRGVIPNNRKCALVCTQK